MFPSILAPLDDRRTLPWPEPGQGTAPPLVEAPLFDAPALMALVHQDWELLAAVAEAYIESRGELHAALDQALREGAPARVQHAAHELLGCLRCLCAEPVVDRVLFIERAAHSGRLEGLVEQLPVLAEQLSCLELELQALLDSATRDTFHGTPHGTFHDSPHDSPHDATPSQLFRTAS